MCNLGARYNLLPRYQECTGGVVTLRHRAGSCEIQGTAFIFWDGDGNLTERRRPQYRVLHNHLDDPSTRTGAGTASLSPIRRNQILSSQSRTLHVASPLAPPLSRGRKSTKPPRRPIPKTGNLPSRSPKSALLIGSPKVRIHTVSKTRQSVGRRNRQMF